MSKDHKYELRTLCWPEELTWESVLLHCYGKKHYGEGSLSKCKRDNDKISWVEILEDKLVPFTF